MSSAATAFHVKAYLKENPDPILPDLDVLMDPKGNFNPISVKKTRSPLKDGGSRSKSPRSVFFSPASHSQRITRRQERRQEEALVGRPSFGFRSKPPA